MTKRYKRAAQFVATRIRSPAGLKASDAADRALKLCVVQSLAHTLKPPTI
jgi:hypothetical protein